jgi:hypothetical protein
LFFALDRVKALAPQHPKWQTREPFASVLNGDLGTALAGSERALLELVAGMGTRIAWALHDWRSALMVTPREVNSAVESSLCAVISTSGFRLKKNKINDLYRAPPAGVEPTTYRLGGGRSIH